MKKSVKLLICTLAVLMTAAGCSNKETGETTTSAAVSESTAETESSAVSEEEEIEKGTVTKLGNYKGLKLSRPSVEVSEEELDERIQSILDANPEYVEVTRAAENGDTVNIDYVGMKDGEAFSGGTSEGFDLELGSDTFIDGFEDGLLGVKTGDERSLNLTFPEEYGNKELAGQDVVFDVTVNSVKEKKDAVLDDAFVQKMSEFQTVDEFREDLRADMKKEKEDQAEIALQDMALQAVLEDSEFDLNQEAVDKHYNEQIDYYRNIAAIYGMEIEDLAEAYGTTWEELETDMREASETTVKQMLLLEAIADAEKMEVTEEDREYMADQLGMELEELKENFAEQLDESAKSFKVVRFLIDQAVITDETAAKDSDSAAETSQD